jgi:hypothetical protein
MWGRIGYSKALSNQSLFRILGGVLFGYEEECIAKNTITKSYDELGRVKLSGVYGEINLTNYFANYPNKNLFDMYYGLGILFFYQNVEKTGQYAPNLGNDFVGFTEAFIGTDVYNFYAELGIQTGKLNDYSPGAWNLRFGYKHPLN